MESPNNGDELTNFNNICSILSEVWCNYKTDKELKDFIEKAIRDGLHQDKYCLVYVSGEDLSKCKFKTHIVGYSDRKRNSYKNLVNRLIDISK